MLDAVIFAVPVSDDLLETVDFTVPYMEYEGRQFAIAVRKGNTELLDAFNGVLETPEARDELAALIPEWLAK